MADQENDKGGKSQRITLRVVGQDIPEVTFRLKMDTPMEKLKRAYSERVGTPVRSLRFIFDGNRIADNKTPKDLEMEDEDIIEVFEEQTGGKI